MAEPLADDADCQPGEGGAAGMREADGGQGRGLEQLAALLAGGVPLRIFPAAYVEEAGEASLLRLQAARELILAGLDFYELG